MQVQGIPVEVRQPRAKQGAMPISVAEADFGHVAVHRSGVEMVPGTDRFEGHHRLCRSLQVRLAGHCRAGTANDNCRALSVTRSLLTARNSSRNSSGAIWTMVTPRCRCSRSDG